MVELADALEEYCPSCGEWVSFLAFNHEAGWCIACSGTYDPTPRCTKCGGKIDEAHGRTMCHACRQEVWLDQHADDLEFLVVTKGYSISVARETIAKLVRPRCLWCGKPIKGAHRGALFHKAKSFKGCRSASLKFKRLTKQGLTSEQALAMLRSTR